MGQVGAVRLGFRRSQGLEHHIPGDINPLHFPCVDARLNPQGFRVKEQTVHVKNYRFKRHVFLQVYILRPV